MSKFHSYTSTKTFDECREKYYLRYTEKLLPKQVGGSLYFGSAVEQGVNHLLMAVNSKTTDDAKLTWKNAFHSGDSGWDRAFDNVGVAYSDKDLETKLLNLWDSQQLISLWESELSETSEGLRAKTIKENPDEFSDNQIVLFNRLSWLSLRNKGYLMVEAFIKQVLPKITEVITIQQELKGEIVEGERRINAVSYIDLVCRHSDYDKPIIFDIKTSASPYESDAILRSAQLGLYSYGLSEELPEHLVGYIVLLKSIGSDSVCSSCGYEKNSTHKTCNNDVNGVRCNGQWDTIYRGDVQVMVEQLSQERVRKVAENFVITGTLADQGLRGQNLESCRKYGMCDYYRYCFYGDKSTLYKKEDK